MITLTNILLLKENGKSISGILVWLENLFLFMRLLSGMLDVIEMNSILNLILIVFQKIYFLIKYF